MKLKRIKTNKEYEGDLNWTDKMFDKKVKPNSPEGEKLQVVLLLIKQTRMSTFPFPRLIQLMRLN